MKWLLLEELFETRDYVFVNEEFSCIKPIIYKGVRSYANFKLEIVSVVASEAAPLYNGIALALTYNLDLIGVIFTPEVYTDGKLSVNIKAVDELIKKNNDFGLMDDDYIEKLLYYKDASPVIINDNSSKIKHQDYVFHRYRNTYVTAITPKTNNFEELVSIADGLILYKDNKEISKECTLVELREYLDSFLCGGWVACKKADFFKEH